MLVCVCVSSGLVKKDPVLPVTMVMPPPSKRTQDSVFDQEDKAKVCVSWCVCVRVSKGYYNI